MNNPIIVLILAYFTLIPTSGLAGLQLVLSAEPVLGTWKITVTAKGGKETNTFKVEEYGKYSTCSSTTKSNEIKLN